MKTTAILILLTLITGCESVTPAYDAKFGESIREANLNMTIHAQAGKNETPLAGMDGKAARETMSLYQDSFKAPPAAVNVINIGGNLNK